MKKIITLGIISALLMVGSVLAGSGERLFMQINHCDDYPADPYCVCDDNETKKMYDWLNGQILYYCEPNELCIDLYAQGWEEQAISLAQAYILAEYPDCPSIECNHTNDVLGVWAYQGQDSEWGVMVECKHYDPNWIMWDVLMLTETCELDPHHDQLHCLAYP